MKSWIRAGVIGLALLLLGTVAVEGVLRASEGPLHPLTNAPLIHKGRLFAPKPASESEWMETSPFLSSERPRRRGTSFVPHQVFPATKAEGTFRVLVVGGTLATGYPYSGELTYFGGLAQRLQEATGKSVELVNAGKFYASSLDVVSFVPELLAYEPDLLVFWCGLREADVAKAVLQRRLWATDVEGAVTHETLVERIAEKPSDVRLLRKAKSALRRFDQPLSSGALAFADGESWRRFVQWTREIYLWNLARITELAEASGCDVMVATVPLHERWPPLGRSFGAAPSEAPDWIAEVLAGRAELREGRAEEALRRLRSASARAESFAPLLYDLALAHEALGDQEGANLHYRRAFACDSETGALPVLNDAIREHCRESAAVLVDLERAFDEAAHPERLFAYSHFPSPEGHELIARELGAALSAKLLPTGGASAHEASASERPWKDVIDDVELYRAVANQDPATAAWLEVTQQLSVGRWAEASQRLSRYSERGFPQSGELRDAVEIFVAETDGHEHGASPCCVVAGTTEPAETDFSGSWRLRVRDSEYTLRVYQEGSDVRAVGLDVCDGWAVGNELFLRTEGPFVVGGSRHCMLQGKLEGEELVGNVRNVGDFRLPFSAVREDR